MPGIFLRTILQNRPADVESPAMRNQGKNTRAEDTAGSGQSGSVSGVVGKYAPPANQEIKEEFGGYKGPEPTRYGDWEKAGRCIDF